MNGLRLAALRTALARHGLDGALVTAPEHVWWLTGADPEPGAAVLVDMDEAAALDGAGRGAALRRAIRSGRRLGSDGRGDPGGASLGLADASAAFGEARRAKDAGELAALEHAAQVVDGALGASRAATVAGATGHEIFAAAAAALASAADDVRLEGNLGAGVTSADPDAVPTDEPLREGEWVFVDLYPRVGRYYGDATRAFSVGRPSAQAERLHRLLWAALDHAADALRPGVPAATIDARCREVLAAEGLEEHFPHHTGHGLGLFQQEPPMLVPGSRDMLREGDVVTLEPGVYLPGVGGMRVEDAFVIEQDGARRLTKAARALSTEAVDG